MEHHRAHMTDQTPDQTRNKMKTARNETKIENKLGGKRIEGEKR